MMQIYLSREGIFPISKDGCGAHVTQSSGTGMAVSGTVQGEGKLCGVASLFVRLQGCNLRCQWSQNMGNGTEHRVITCDTLHAQEMTWTRPNGTAQPQGIDVAEVETVIERNMGKMHHLVITGGEPYLQAEAVGMLIDHMRDCGIHTTVETNGTCGVRTLCSGEMATVTLPLADLSSISPKLSSAGLSARQILMSRLGTLAMVRQVKAEGRDVQLKFVIASAADQEEIERDYAEVLTMVEPSDVLVMPLGATPEELARSQKAALDMAVRNGWRFGPRLHIDLFGNKEGT